MHRIMFVCYGNVCRSTMAEFLMKDLVKKAGAEKDFYICSSGTSYEECGNPVYHGTRVILDRLGIHDYVNKRAEKLLKEHYNDFDLFIGMDEQNRRDMLRIFGKDHEQKIKLLMDYTKRPRSVADPYWTGDFESTYQDVNEGVLGLFNALKDS
ncbi:MAG: low molecular weight phosphotyrosine protein phosphatase [Clostridia bacterium]|nr:low molecular weight phosphotyrosine protein phosphatase [Clostridia bacterium]